ncbi:MAG: protein kinase [Thermoplasmatales archaeon A-plasma]|jgi:serine/threonine protein kinase|nr:MAG: protein kinase [Thermoplasmatales archaeon A-plasma]
MASRSSLIMRALSASLAILAILFLANSYVHVFPSPVQITRIVVLLFLSSFTLVVAAKIADNGKSGYRIARSTLVGFAWIYFVFWLILDLIATYPGALSASFSFAVETYFGQSLQWLPYFVAVLSGAAFAAAIASRAPVKNKISGEAIILGSFMILTFIPFINHVPAILDSIPVFLRELLYLSIPIAAVEAYFMRFKFHRQIAKFLILGNMVMLPQRFNASILFLLRGFSSPNVLEYPILYLLLSYILLIIAVTAVVYIFRGISPPMFAKKVAGAALPLAGGYLILSYFHLLPLSFENGSLNYHDFLSARIYFILVIAVVILAVLILLGRVIASRGGKGSVLYGSVLLLSIYLMYRTGYSGHFQFPLVAGMVVTAAVVGSATQISRGMKESFLGSYDLLKTVKAKPKKSQPVSRAAVNPNPTPVRVVASQKQAVKPSLSANVPDFWIGREISGYTVTEIISRETGFAYVLKASRPGEPDVAIKILKPFASDGTKIAFDNEFLRKFLMEFQNVMVLNGRKYVVNIIGVGLRTYPDDSTKMDKYKENPPAIVMELLQGGKLSDLDFKFNTQKQMELFFEIAIRVSQGLQDAHDARILHGDIKPDNIMFASRNGFSVKTYSRTPEKLIQAIRKDEIIPKIVDFGSAKIRGLGNIVFSQFSVLYSPPEILMSNYDTDETYDVYEFGMVMYYLLTGSANDFRTAKNLARRQVFIESRVNSGKFYTDRNMLIREASAVPLTEPSKVNPLVRKPLQYLIMRCIDPDPANRYSDMSEIKKSLVHCAAKDYGFKSVRDI